MHSAGEDGRDSDFSGCNRIIEQITIGHEVSVPSQQAALPDGIHPGLHSEQPDASGCTLLDGSGQVLENIGESIGE